MIQTNKFLEIVRDSSKLSSDLREIQKTVQNYDNMLHFVPQRVDKILENWEEILGILKDIQTRIQKLEQQPSSSKRTSGRWLPPSFGTELLLHQQGKARVVLKPLTEEEKMINLKVCLRIEINLMTTLEKIDLEDLQELAKSFANLKVVDLKMNTAGGEIPAITWSSYQKPPKKSVGSHNLNMRESQFDFHTGGGAHPAGTRTRRNQILLHQTPYGKTVLDPIHPYGIMLNLDVLDFKNREDLIDDWTSAMRIAAGTLDLNKEGFIKLLEMSLMGSMKIAWDMTSLEMK